MTPSPNKARTWAQTYRRSERQENALTLNVFHTSANSLMLLQHENNLKPNVDGTEIDNLS